MPGVQGILGAKSKGTNPSLQTFEIVLIRSPRVKGHPGIKNKSWVLVAFPALPKSRKTPDLDFRLQNQTLNKNKKPFESITAW